jgi:hypothetical protein
LIYINLQGPQILPPPDPPLYPDVETNTLTMSTYPVPEEQKEKKPVAYGVDGGIESEGDDSINSFTAIIAEGRSAF